MTSAAFEDTLILGSTGIYAEKALIMRVKQFLETKNVSQVQEKIQKSSSQHLEGLLPPPFLYRYESAEM